MSAMMEPSLWYLYLKICVVWFYTIKKCIGVQRPKEGAFVAHMEEDFGPWECAEDPLAPCTKGPLKELSTWPLATLTAGPLDTLSPTGTDGQEAPER